LFGSLKHSETAMDLRRITRADRPIIQAEWEVVIASHPTLEPMPDRTGINPFTNETTVFPGKGKAFYVADRRRVGNASLEEGEILASGIPQDVCEEIGRRLGAAVFKDDRS
jgi:hypothetical protein